MMQRNCFSAASDVGSNRKWNKPPDRKPQFFNQVTQQESALRVSPPYKLLCSFPFNTSASKLTTHMGLLGGVVINFYSSLVCTEVVLCLAITSNAINVWPRALPNWGICLLTEHCSLIYSLSQGSGEAAAGRGCTTFYYAVNCWGRACSQAGPQFMEPIRAKRQQLLSLYDFL